ncbi:MAG: tetratricopeptide repeat protein [Pseudomonadales bacterium]
MNSRLRACNSATALTLTLICLLYPLNAQSLDDEQSTTKRIIEQSQLIRQARRGHAAAQLELGRRYEQGNGAKQDDHLAERWLARAAEQGNREVQYELGTLHAYRDTLVSNEALATHWFRRAAEQGHSDAQFHVGLAYQNGFGLNVDLAKAIHWYKQAAANEHSSAEFRLGVIYSDGLGVPKSEEDALHWFKRSAERGNASAQFNLAYYYFNGVGVPKDKKLATNWMQKAADNGINEASRELAKLAQQAKIDAKRADALVNTVWHLDHGEYRLLNSNPSVLGNQEALRNQAIYDARPKVEALLQTAGKAQVILEPRLGLGKRLSCPATWTLDENQLEVICTDVAFAAPLTNYANSGGWYKVQEEGPGQLREGMITYVMLVQDVRAGRNKDPDALTPHQERNYPNEGEFVRSVSSKRVASPQPGWGGMKVAKNISLDCLVNQCDQLLEDKGTVPLTPKSGHEFVEIEATVTNTDTLVRVFSLDLIASFFDSSGKKLLAKTWHVPAKAPKQAGWTDTPIKIKMSPGVSWTLKWLYEVRSERRQGSRFMLWGQQTDLN